MGVVRPFPPAPAIFAEPGGPFRGNLLHTLWKKIIVFSSFFYRLTNREYRIREKVLY